MAATIPKMSDTFETKSQKAAQSGGGACERSTPNRGNLRISVTPFLPLQLKGGTQAGPLNPGPPAINNHRMVADARAYKKRLESCPCSNELIASNRSECGPVDYFRNRRRFLVKREYPTSRLHTQLPIFCFSAF
jgi:hypothetical protein